MSGLPTPAIDDDVATYHWSRMPGKFLNSKTGEEIGLVGSLMPGPMFQGSVREWYDCLAKLLIDVVNESRQCPCCDVVAVFASPTVSHIIDCTISFRKLESSQIEPLKCAFKIGTLNRAIDVYYSHLVPPASVMICSAEKHIATVVVHDCVEVI